MLIYCNDNISAANQSTRSVTKSILPKCSRQAQHSGAGQSTSLFVPVPGTIDNHPSPSCRSPDISVHLPIHTHDTHRFDLPPPTKWVVPTPTPTTYFSFTLLFFYLHYLPHSYQFTFTILSYHLHNLPFTKRPCSFSRHSSLHLLHHPLLTSLSFPFF